MKQSLRHFAVFLLWNLGVSLVLLWVVRPERRAWEAGAGLLVMVALAVLVLDRYLLRRGSERAAERAETLRLAPLRGRALLWTLVAAPVVLLFSWALADVYIRLVPVPPHALDPFGDLFGTAAGRLALALLAIGIAPLLEELFFRGLIQRALELRWGAVAGAVGGALFFALAHFLPWIFPLHFMLGLCFAFAVYATGSIWAGVILHAVNNCTAYLLLGGDHSPETQTVWITGLTGDFAVAGSMLLASVAAGTYVALRMLAAGRASGLRYDSTGG